MLDVRLATVSDVPQIVSFLEGFCVRRRSRRGARDYFDGSYLVAHPSEAGSNKDHPVLLCFREYDLLGVGGLGIEPTDAVSRGHLELFCADEHRDVTEVVRRLILAAEDEARSRSVSELDVVSLPGDQILKSSLEERGYRARLLILHRTL